MTTTVFRLILLFVHLVISVEESIALMFRRMMKLLLRVLTFADPGSDPCFDPCSALVIRQRSARLRRLPVHLGIVIVEENLHVIDIVRIVAWSMAAGISYITIYDHKGHCKKNKSTILRILEEQKEQLERNAQYRKCSTMKECNGVSNPLTKDGDCKREKPKLRIIGPEDGRQHLVSVARQLSRKVTNCEIKNDDIIVPFVDAVIHGEEPDPDPDLVMKFGAVSSLLGFIPWQIRLTEIVSLPTHHQIDFTSYFAALDRFGYTEQRCGK